MINRRDWLAVSSAALLATGCKKAAPVLPDQPSRASGRLRQEGYLWQRAWTPAISPALQDARDHIDGFAILAAEVEWDGKTPRLIRPKFDSALIGKLGKPAGLAVRIGPFGGPFGENETSTRKITGWIKETIASARAGGWEPSELQIDFDAATTKLSGYQTWLRIFKQVASPLPVSFTALPDWLRSPLLQEMARECGRYVLQVHAVERARTDAARPVLVEQKDARRWVEQAGQLGVPFRVALPTYRSAVGFDADGKIIGIDSEGPARKWPIGTTVVTYFSPAVEIASLISDWSAGRPQAMEGVIWYRLPVAGESRNWTWPTLAPVMSGRAPIEKCAIDTEGGNPVDLLVRNAGESELPWPAVISVEAAGRIITAGDALDGYELKLDAALPNTAAFHRSETAAAQILPPSRKKSLGWLRFSSDISTDPTTRAHEIIISFR